VAQVCVYGAEGTVSAGVRRVVIIGAGGHGRVVREIVALQAHLEVSAFYDDDQQKWGRVIDGTPVLGHTDCLREGKRPADAVVIAVGGTDNRPRAELFNEMAQLGYEMVSVVHPHSCVSESVTIGRGFVGMAGIIVNPGAEIGDDVCINTGASVDHDCRLGHHCSIFPNASVAGGVTIGPFACIGQNASVNQYLSIGAFSVVGAGAVVTKDLPDHVVAVGVPARVIRSTEEPRAEGGPP